jgi:hypothetical protein
MPSGVLQRSTHWRQGDAPVDFGVPGVVLSAWL